MQIGGLLLQACCEKIPRPCRRYAAPSAPVFDGWIAHLVEKKGFYGLVIGAWQYHGKRLLKNARYARLKSAVSVVFRTMLLAFDLCLLD